MEAVTLWNENGLHVWVNWGTEGKLVLQGQSLSGGGEYEYALSVLSEDVPKVVAALGGDAGADAIDLIKANSDSIVRQGEQTWLKSLGITPGFWARSSD